MGTISRIRGSKVLKNSVAAYSFQFSLLVCGLAAIPAMVRHLSKEQIAIWVVASSLGSFMSLFDLGIGDAIGRKIAGAVASGDQSEINRWWSVSKALLVCMALPLLVAGLCLAPWFSKFMSLSAEMAGTANHVFGWMVVITALGMLNRGVTGLLVAQERAHLPLLGQTLAAWINLIVLLSLLSMGKGIFSCVIAYGARMLVIWVYYFALVRFGPNPPRWDASGLEMNRIKSLFGFSFSFCFTMIVDLAFSSLPTLALARFGGTALVPALAFSGRASNLLVGFVNRTFWAFYPGLLQLQLAGHSKLLAMKHRRASLLTFALSLFVAGGIVTFNRSFVTILAGEEFYVGVVANAVLAMIVLVVPASHVFRSFLNLGGSMGRVAVLAVVSTAIAVALSWGGYKIGGLPGLLVPFFIPVVALGAYGWLHGTRMCGFPRTTISLVGVYGAIAACMLLMVPTLMDHLGYGTVQHLTLWGRRIPLPTPAEWGVFLVCCGVSGMIGWRLFKDFKGVVEPKAA